MIEFQLHNLIIQVLVLCTLLSCNSFAFAWSFSKVDPWIYQWSSRNAHDGGGRNTLLTRAKTWAIHLVLEHQNEPPMSNDEKPWSHSDIDWCLEPPEGTSLLQRIQLKAAANAIRTELLLKGEAFPPLLCPKGGQAVLEAYVKGKSKRIAKFGITTTRGPPAAEIISSLQTIYNVTEAQASSAGVAAIIYMFVEPEYRRKGIGELALEAIAAIHIIQGCDFTVLVADDNGTGKLIHWYEKNGFTKVPQLEPLFGTMGGKYGMPMIRPTTVAPDILARCQIKYW